jgi:hypothetical protein
VRKPIIAAAIVLVLLVGAIGLKWRWDYETLRSLRSFHPVPPAQAAIPVVNLTDIETSLKDLDGVWFVSAPEKKAQRERLEGFRRLYEDYVQRRGA